MGDLLAPLLAKLQEPGGAPPARGAFVVLRIPKYPKHYFGVTDNGAPCLLIHSVSGGPSIGTPLRLQGLEVQYNVPCKIILQTGATRKERLTTVLCAAKSALERQYFLHACELVLRIVGQDPPLSSVVSAAEHLASIFQRLILPARKPLTGLLGELILIACSASPHDAIAAWRSSLDDTFDFALGQFRVEVKASQDRIRAHFLSYEQCEPPAGVAVALVSVIIESSGGGISLWELLEEIEQKVAGRHDAIMRLHTMVAATLGQSFANALAERFDRQLAQQSLLFFDIRSVPAIRGPLPKGVNNVRFRADLSHAVAISPSSFHQAGPGASLLLPS